jgi:hypothetical protein
VSGATAGFASGTCAGARCGMPTAATAPPAIAAFKNRRRSFSWLFMVWSSLDARALYCAVRSGTQPDDKHPTFFTAVADFVGLHSGDFLEIIALGAVGLKTFRTIARVQVRGINGQMAMSTPHPGFLGWQEDKLTMRTGGHIASLPWEVYACCSFVFFSEKILSGEYADKHCQPTAAAAAAGQGSASGAGQVL